MQFEWFSVDHADAYVLMVHGLNLRPAKMRSFAKLLQNENMSVLNVFLSGHGNLNTKARLQAFTQVNYVLWLEEMREAYSIIVQQAQGKPIYLMGYSLGALMGLNAMVKYPQITFNKAFFIAPAIKIHTQAYIVYLMSLFPEWIIRSASPPNFRANRGTPVNAYLALYQAIASLENPNKALNIPVKIIMDEKDELVSLTKIKQWIIDHSLTKWSIMSVNKRLLPSHDFHHLLVGEKGAGNVWNALKNALLAHFSLP